MKLYLVRHGEATHLAEESGRPLSQAGLKEVSIVSKFLGQHHIEIGQIYHSGKLRAEQTANELARAIQPQPKVDVLSGLLPNDEVKPILPYCNNWKKNTMLVGHLPFMGKLASTLLFEKEEGDCIHFQTAAVLCLERAAAFHWSINWFLSPSLMNEKGGEGD
jgi:phosphohistidine phosphatase